MKQYYTYFAGTREKGAIGVGEWRHFVGHFESVEEAHTALQRKALERYELTGSQALQRETSRGPVQYDLNTYLEIGEQWKDI
jgi:hypothetical protein